MSENPQPSWPMAYVRACAIVLLLGVMVWFFYLGISEYNQMVDWCRR